MLHYKNIHKANYIVNNNAMSRCLLFRSKSQVLGQRCLPEFKRKMFMILCRCWVGSGKISGSLRGPTGAIIICLLLAPNAACFQWRVKNDTLKCIALCSQYTHTKAPEVGNNCNRCFRYFTGLCTHYNRKMEWCIIASY